MSTGENLTTAAGLVKQAYDNEINKKVVPVSGILQKEIDFVPAEQREGAQWNQPVLTSLPTGFTYGAGLATYQTIVPSQTQYASLTGSNITLQDGIAFDLISRTISNKNSFMTAAKYTLMALEKGEKRQLETDLLYGGSGLGQTSVATNDSATQETLTITSATWAPAIWSGYETCKLAFYHGATDVSNSGGAVYTLASVSVVNQTITVTGLSADITALNAAINSSSYTLDIYVSNSKGNQMVGLKSILTTTSGNLFGLSVTNYSVWAPNSFDCQSAPLSLGKVENAAALAAARGAEDEELSVLVNPNNYANLVVEASSARRFDSSYKQGKLSNGARYLEYFGPSGLIKIVAHPFVKQGEAFMVPFERMKRVGSVDVTFDLPGFSGPALYVPSASFTGVLLSMFTSQALFLEAPSHSVILQNVVASTN